MNRVKKIGRYIASTINNMSIQRKFIMVYGTVIVIPICIVLLILLNKTQKLAMDTSMKQVYNQVEEVTKQLKQMQTVAIRSSNKLYIDKELKDLFETRYTNYEETYIKFNNYKLYKDIVDINLESLKKIVMLTNNSTILNSDFGKYISNDELEKSERYKEFLVNKNIMRWDVYTARSFEKNIENEIVFLRKMRFRDSTIGILHIYINMNAVKQILNNQLCETLIVDSNGKIIVAGNNNLVDKNIEEFGYDMERKDLKYYDGLYNDEKVRFVKGEGIFNNKNNRIYVISIFNLEEIYTEVSNIKKIGIMIALISMLIGSYFVIIVSNLMIKRIKQLSRNVNHFAAGEILECNEISGNDEIGVLEKNINIMINNLNTLVNEIYIMNEAEKELISKQKEIEFEMLINQINPHFIFNTLETIRMKAHCHGEDEVADIIQRFGSLLRKNLNVNQGMTLVEEEVFFIDNYLFIQKSRFGEKLSYKINTECDIKEMKILPLIIQPLIENAVVHGIENKEENGWVILTISRDQNNICFEVKDNGVGISKERLSKLRKDILEKDIKRSHIGVKNVAQRLVLYYGEECGLTIESEENVGTSIRFNIPESKINNINVLL